MMTIGSLVPVRLKKITDCLSAGVLIERQIKATFRTKGWRFRMNCKVDHYLVTT